LFHDLLFQNDLKLQWIEKLKKREFLPPPDICGMMKFLILDGPA